MKEDKVYKIKKGDTLWGISKKFYGVGNLYYLIVRKNNITNPDKIRVGKKIIIPDVELVEKVEE